MTDRLPSIPCPPLPRSYAHVRPHFLVVRFPHTHIRNQCVSDHGGSVTELTTDSRVFLSTLPPGRRERRLALAVVLITAVAFILAAPFAKVQLPRVWAFIPVYESAIVVCDLLTAALLIGQYRILRSKALLVLATGYLLTAFTATAHLLTFPGVFSDTGWLGARSQSTAWLYVFWHGSFPLVIIAYAWLKGDAAQKPTHRASACAAAILTAVAFAALVAIAFAILATRGYDWLPQQLSGPSLAPRYTAAHAIVLTLIWSISLLALATLLRRRPHSVLDLWLMVVMCAWLFDITFAGVLNHGRFDLGFYAGRIYSLCAASFVLVILTLENIDLYARVVQSLESERIERATRSTADGTAERSERIARAACGVAHGCAHGGQPRLGQ